MGREERGVLFAISAPSGTGKSSLARRVLSAVPALGFSVSYTTRARRPGEEEGREYRFVDEARFDGMVAAGDFLEWACVFGKRYGTGGAAVERVLAEGRDLLLDIDVQGGRQVRERGIGAVTIFVLPPDFDTLATRLRSRGSEADAEVTRRLSLARREAEEYVHYDYLIVNDNLDHAAEDLCSIVRAERRRVGRRRGVAQRIVNGFPPS